MVLVAVGAVTVIRLFPSDEDHAKFYAGMVALFGGPKSVAVLYCVGLLLLIVTRSYLRHLWQAQKDEAGREILLQLSDGKKPTRDFVLYLRAFDTTGKLKVPIFMFDFQLNRLRVTNEFESYFSHAVRKTGPLIALGRPGGNIGAGRILTSDNTWKDDLTLLAEQAKLILIIPSDHTGTFYEMEMIRHNEHLADKCVFVMPPTVRRGFDWGVHWREAREKAASIGLTLPEYYRYGLLFTIGHDGKVRNAEPFSPLYGPIFLKRSLARLARLDTPADPVRALVRAERKSRRQFRMGRWAFRLNLALPVIAGVGVGLASLISSVAEPSLSADSQQKPATALQELLTSPLYKDKTRGMSQEQAGEVLAQLIQNGIPRLEDEALVGYYAGFGEMLNKSDLKTCGAFVGGQSTNAQNDHVLGALGEKLDAWNQIQYHAALLELQQVPIPSASSADINKAKVHLASLLGLTVQQLDTLFTQSNPTPADTCRVMRVLYGSVAQLEEPYNRVWARYLAGETR